MSVRTNLSMPATVTIDSLRNRPADESTEPIEAVPVVEVTELRTFTEASLDAGEGSDDTELEGDRMLSVCISRGSPTNTGTSGGCASPGAVTIVEWVPEPLTLPDPSALPENVSEARPLMEDELSDAGTTR